MSATYSYTLWPGLYARTEPYSVQESWAEFVRRFSTHASYPDKFSAPGFGPYSLAPPPGPCARHGGLTVPHRCDRCVVELTLAVFDVDCGTADQVAACDAALGLAKVARLWFSTWSYRPDAPRPSLRLVLPLAQPVPPTAWRFVRARILERFVIPADLDKCGGASHFYFGPSHPVGGSGVVDVGAGEPLDVAAWVARAPVSFVGTVDEYWPDEIEEGEGPLDLEPARAAVQRKAAALARGSSEARAKAGWLRRVLAGEPFAEHGSRNQTTLRVTGVIAHAAPDAPLGALRALVRPSVDAMIAAGSKLTYETVDRMLTDALARARAKVARDRALVANLGTWSRSGRAARKAKDAARRARKP